MSELEENLECENEQKQGTGDLETHQEEEPGSTKDTAENLMSSNSQQPQNYKTVLCIYHEKGGTCKYRDSCIFAHGQKELRFTRQSFVPTLSSNTFPNTAGKTAGGNY